MLVTVQNKLTLVRSLKSHMQERITKHPIPLVIQEMGKCLDLEDILKKEETAEVKQEREKSLKKSRIRRQRISRPMRIVAPIPQ